MSFFGFDATLPRDRVRDRQQQGADRGFFETRQDPFAGFKGRETGDGEEVINFDDTYDGLGDQLDEAGDTFNDDTFGGGGKIGKDFDFSGQTAHVRPTLQEEQVLHHARQPPPKGPVFQQPARPTRTGYEGYAKPDYIPQLEANASIWGLPAKQTPEPYPQQRQQQQHAHGQAQAQAASRKMMSLEEVEAAMRQQGRPSSAAPPFQQAPVSLAEPLRAQDQAAPVPPFTGTPQILQRPQQSLQQSRAQGMPPPSMTHAPGPPLPIPQANAQQAPVQPVQILQNPNSRQPTPSSRTDVPAGPPAQATHQRGPSHGGPPIMQAQQMMQLSEDDRASLLAEEAKRAKRNHKIFLLSKDNGLMTPQDKNFITRIQLQQLMTATGGLDEHGPDSQLAEDFYYQVYAQIRGAPRQNPNQPLSQFAQTYLFQTGGRYGGGRRHPRGGENHIQRMEQQVQRAVEAAKARPKIKQLTVVGSLGKIAFSNSKTPRPLLNFKRIESERQQSARGLPKVSVADRKATLRNIENVYSTLMKMEDHERHLPPPPTEESNPAAIQMHIEWRQRAQEFNQQLWSELKVMEPIQPNPSTPHPFIAILSHSKGKKAIPRIFRVIDDQQRVTMLTLIAIHLDVLDVVRLAYPNPDEPQLPRAVRDEIELFSQAVIPPLFTYVNDAPLNIISGLLGLILDRVSVQVVIRTKIGVSTLTMLISRAELIKQSNATGVTDDDWAQWNALYARLFDLCEPVLPYIFSAESVNNSEDVHVWQFLAAMGVGASPEQQQRLVLGVKDRVMETVGVSKTLPPDMASRKLSEVNLFMRAIGLDVDLLG